MRYPILLVVLAASCFAQVQSFTITDTSGSAQTNRPVTVGAWFKQGDIPHYAQARIGGVLVNTQCDVKNQWPDGSLQYGIVSFVAPSIGANAPITVDYVNQSTGNNTGYLNGTAMLATSNFGATTTVTTGSAQSADIRTMIAAGKFSYWLQGSIVTQVIVEDATSARVYDMGSDANKSLHPAYIATFYPTTSAGVKVDFMLENMWTTVLQHQQYQVDLATGYPSPATVYTKPATWAISTCTNASPIVCTTTTDHGLGYDSTICIDGVTGNTAANGCFNPRSITHNTFALWTIDNTASSGNGAYGTGGTVRWTHAAGTRWRKTLWSGTQPGTIKIVPNLAYLTAAYAVPNYDTSTSMTSAGISDETGYWSGKGTNGDISATGSVWKLQGDTAGRPELAFMPRWTIRWLFSGDATIWAETAGNADAAGMMPIHFRESAAGKYYDSGHTVAAIGNELSLDARPTIASMDPTNLTLAATASGDKFGVVTLLTVTSGTYASPIEVTTSTNHGLSTGALVQVINGYCGSTGVWGITVTAANKFQLVGSVGSCAMTGGNVFTVAQTDSSSTNGWNIDTAHSFDATSIPYLATGDYYWLTEIYYQTAARLAASNPCKSGLISCRHADWGVLGSPEVNGARDTAWAIRQLWLAYKFAPDASPQKVYYKQKLDNNIANFGGVFNVADGLSHTCSSSPFNASTETNKWCWGSNVGRPNPADANPLHFLSGNHDGSWLGQSDTTYTWGTTAPWMNNFLHVTLGVLAENYTTAQPLQQTLAKNLLNQLQNPSYNPYLADCYQCPSKQPGTYTDSTSLYYTSWSDANILLGITNNVSGYTPPPNYRAKTSFDPNHTTNSSGYAHIAKAAASFLPGITDGGLSGSGAWTWITNNANLPTIYQNLKNHNPS